ncbi:single-pass membrane and coiled-coil domain-containing protein 1 isoform X3 [Mastomys coucha]|uniref:single-pass membrane and coiled-coil domain-containing protein 1 isoform X3 n=1 Tax=Mastomys coucha TaxID=35658 RepID=UPI0012624C25|nr:single-pass membrane and coiled-coil domain-containing protein 1 isoform X3 [Mastomys coucha]
MFPSLLPVAEWKKIGISASTECSSCCVLFPFLFLKKMNHETTTLISLKEAMKRFTSMELNILYSYVIEVLICLHTRMLQKLPDLVRSLPTLASVLRRKAKNKHVRIVWESVLEEYGLQERDVTALCTFFLVHGNKGEHYAANVRQMYIKDVSFMITNMVKNQALQDGLLRAVQIIEEGKAAQTPENSRAPLKELMPPVKD